MASEWESHAVEVHGWGEYGMAVEGHAAIRSCEECIDYQRRLMESEEWK